MKWLLFVFILHSSGLTVLGVEGFETLAHCDFAAQQIRHHDFGSSLLRPPVVSTVCIQVDGGSNATFSQ